jgi:hypothetical protein
MEVKIGSKTYECDRFGLIELADLQDWMQERKEDRILARARKAYPDELPIRIYDDMSKEITLDELEDAIASDIRSIGYLIFLTVKKGHADVTFDEICKNIGDIEAAVKILGDISPKAAPKKKELTDEE